MSTSSCKDLSTPNLSKRMGGTMQTLLPKLESQIAARRRNAAAEDSKIDLSTAENALLRPELCPLYIEVLSKGLQHSHLSYPDGVGGAPELVNALPTFFNRHFDPVKKVLPSEIVVAPGATACLEALLHCICDPGDAVLVMAPYWNGFNITFSVRPEVHIVPVGGENGFESILSSVDLLVGSLDAAVTSCRWPVRALVLTNPHNPFGRCYSTAMISACAQFCQRRGLHLISDEVYALSTFGQETDDPSQHCFQSVLQLDLPALGVDPERVHVVWSTSKDFGSSGIRVGAVVSQANAPLRLSMVLASDKQVSSLAAIATAGLLTHPNLEQLIELNKQRLREAYSKLTVFLEMNGIRFIPAYAGVFVFARLPLAEQSHEAEIRAIKALARAGVLVSPGSSYSWSSGEYGWVRIVFAVEPKTLDEGLRRIERGLRDLYD